MKNPLVTLILIVSSLIVSCRIEEKQDKISSGRIDYKITYLNKDLDNKVLELLPKRMKLTFNEKQAVNNIEGFLGLYKLNAITNFHTRKCATLLKIVDKHYIFKGKRDELMCCFDSMEGMKIKETDETKSIAGFNCRKAVVYLPSTNNSFDIYYTGDISLKRPNSTNPYKNIDGVLMEFELNLLYLRMRFTAENFQSWMETPSDLPLPKNLKTISREQMTEILNRLMD